MDSRVAQRIRELIVEGVLAARHPRRRGDASPSGLASRGPRCATCLAGPCQPKDCSSPPASAAMRCAHFTIDDSYRATEIRCVLEGYAARELAARHGPRPASLRCSATCLREGDAIFAKGHVVKEDEEAYAQMNGRFHRPHRQRRPRSAVQPTLSTASIRCPSSPRGRRLEPDPARRNLSDPDVRPSPAPRDRRRDRAGQPDVAEILMRGHSTPAQANARAWRVAARRNNLTFSCSAA